MTRARLAAAAVLLAALGACSHGSPTAVATATSTATTTTVAAGGQFATVADLSRWLTSQGIECPLRPDGKSCSLRSAKGATTTPEVVGLAVAPTEDQLDRFFTENGNGYMLSGETWALHLANRDNAKALLVALPHANYWHATPMTVPG